MTVHLLKLCVGVDEVAELAAWQDERLQKLKRIYHVTRMVPKRKSEVLDGGSIYWVIRGLISVRQRIVAIEPFTDDEGIERCKLVFDRDLVPVRPAPRRAFQGWRYLEADDAPPDVKTLPGSGELSDTMRAELAALGLL
ncbi:MAG: DUF1489 domain-containing protein [Hyphomicrobiales bacterium]